MRFVYFAVKPTPKEQRTTGTNKISDFSDLSHLGVLTIDLPGVRF